MEAISYFKFALSAYVNFVKIGNEAFENNFTFQGSPVLAKRQKILPAIGVINTAFGSMSYRFHGDGCEFVFDSLIVDFDYIYRDNNYNSFKPDKFFWFIEQNNFPVTVLKNRNTFNEIIFELLLNGYLVNRNEDSMLIYDICF